MKDLRLPNINGASLREQVGQIVSYLRYLCTALQRRDDPVVNQSKTTVSDTSDVVSSGKLNGWYFVKHRSGIAECWRREEQTIDVNKAWGNHYYGNCNSISFPFHFVEVPQCCASIESHYDYGAYSMILGGNGLATKDKPGNYIAVSPTAHTGVKCVVNYHVVGRWK